MADDRKLDRQASRARHLCSHLSSKDRQVASDYAEELSVKASILRRRPKRTVGDNTG